MLSLNTEQMSACMWNSLDQAKDLKPTPQILKARWWQPSGNTQESNTFKRLYTQSQSEELYVIVKLKTTKVMSLAGFLHEHLPATKDLILQAIIIAINLSRISS